MQSTMLAMQANHEKATTKMLESQRKSERLAMQLAQLQTERATFVSGSLTSKECLSF